MTTPHQHDPEALERIDELLQYLPRFAAPGRTFVQRWSGGEPAPDGAVSMPHPVYDDDVLEFFGLAAQPWWSDHGYVAAQADRMLQDDGLVERATLAEIKTMLTHCVRGERFCDGHWERLLTSGRVTALLRRLAVLRGGLES
jgi:hypothetical protein